MLGGKNVLNLVHSLALLEVAQLLNQASGLREQAGV
jgi:hypothetical protein